MLDTAAEKGTGLSEFELAGCNKLGGGASQEVERGIRTGHFAAVAVRITLLIYIGFFTIG